MRKSGEGKGLKKGRGMSKLQENSVEKGL